jgi:diguanylate cyclase (GGDEF)-like protein
MGTLLIVDDDELTRNLASRQFEQQGFRVLRAASGPEALAILAIERVDLVLLDVVMPGMSGLDVLRAMRIEHGALHLPVVMATALDHSDNVVEALESGATDYVTKPIDFPVTLARVRTHLRAARAQQALRTSEERYALAALGSSDGLFDWDLQTDRVYDSERWAALLGVPHNHLTPLFSEWLSRVHPEEQVRVAQELRAHLEGTTSSWESEHRIRHADGQYRWVLARGMAKRDADGRPVRLAGSLASVSHARVADPLTGLPNRLLFLDRLHHALAAARAERGPRFAVLFMDLDGFKIVNDHLGHVTGDELLVQVARRIEAGVRRTDHAGHLSERRTVSRLGGDEFAILLEDIADEAAALAVAERLHQAMGEPFLVGGRPVHTTLSIGVVLDAPRYGCAEELMRDADAAMYRAKKRGRGKSEVFTAAVLAETQEREQIAGELGEAIASGDIAAYYQPIVHLAGGTLEGFEALARWRHPRRGLLSPDAFLDAAEETALIVPLTYHILDRAARDLRHWRERWPAAARLTMSVNVAPRLFADADVVERIVRIVRDAGLAPGDMKIEIVEATLIDAGAEVLTRLTALREAGFGIALDDFGTGYSSIGHLHAFPLSTLKIDRTFVNRMNEVSDEHVQMVRSITSLAHNLGMDVTAEGIETAAQVRWLQSLACVLGQGYFFERALPADAIAHLLEHPQFVVPDATPRDGVRPC